MGPFSFWPFFVRSLYAKLIDGTPTNKFSPIWRARIPPKVNIFLWQAFRGRLPLTDQICKRSGPGLDRCMLCDALEDTNHIFFHCALAKLVWSCIRPCFTCRVHHPLFLNFGSSTTAWLGSLSIYFGSDWGQFAGPCGLPGTNLPSSMFFLLNLLIAYLNIAYSCSSGDH